MSRRAPTYLTPFDKLSHDAIVVLLAFSALGCSDSQFNQEVGRLTKDTTQDESTQFAASHDADALSVTQQVDLELASHAELMKKIEEMRGHFVVLDIWSTSCPPCLAELPNLMVLANDSSLDVRCVSFNLDYIGLKNRPPAEYLKKVSSVLGQFGDSPTKHFLSTEKDFDVFGKFDISSIPAVFVFDREGNQIFPPKALDGNASDEVSETFESDEVSYERDILPLLRKLAATNENLLNVQ